MNKSKKILDEVLKEISPSKEETEILEKETTTLIKQIKKNLKREKVILGGSLAKGTLIKKEEQDVDIFIVFEDEDSTKNLEKILKKSKIIANKIHGSRDYFQLKKERFLFEIIPIVKINKENKNVTDFSPLHVEYIKKKANKKTLQEIKLAKAFCIAQGTYGAESYIQGLSGYALELLICHYKSFLTFLKKIQKEEFIDLEKKFKNKKEAFREINESKLCSPLILIDPTNKYRNVCAGLGEETWIKLWESAKNFLKSPSKNFFQLELFNQENFVKEAKSKKLEVHSIEISIERENKDIAGTKMKKFFNFIIKELAKNQQEVISSNFLYSGGKKSKALIAIKKKEILEIKGPRKDMKSALDKFQKIRKKIYFMKGFAYTKENFLFEQFFEKRKEIANSMDVDFEWKKI